MFFISYFLLFFTSLFFTSSPLSFSLLFSPSSSPYPSPLPLLLLISFFFRYFSLRKGPNGTGRRHLSHFSLALLSSVDTRSRFPFFFYSISFVIFTSGTHSLTRIHTHTPLTRPLPFDTLRTSSTCSQSSLTNIVALFIFLVLYLTLIDTPPS
ncbi:MAG: hypothetical protein JOS17DRAFT_744615 [Linnemannia elongata]|nr:MAG: hypothetical protein JOS17DRAFT_744615 [Linnemannia elongata]